MKESLAWWEKQCACAAAGAAGRFTFIFNSILILFYVMLLAVIWLKRKLPLFPQEEGLLFTENYLRICGCGTMDQYWFVKSFS